MSNYKIVASDLDGTLLNSNDRISEENWQAIREMTARGVYFVPCTGRTLHEMDPVLRDNPAVRYIIHSDGAVVYDKQTDRRITACMEGEDVRFILNMLLECDTHLTVRYERNTYIDVNKSNRSKYKYYRMSEPYQECICERFAIKTENFEEFCHGLDNAEMICAFFHNDDEAAECAKRIEETGKYFLAYFKPYCYEIFSREAGKGNALLRLADEIGIDRSQTIGVGDSCNDMTLIGSAGLGLCMSNGYDEPKAIADEIICSNDEHAMKYILEHYL